MADAYISSKIFSNILITMFVYVLYTCVGVHGIISGKRQSSLRSRATVHPPWRCAPAVLLSTTSQEAAQSGMLTWLVPFKAHSHWRLISD